MPCRLFNKCPCLELITRTPEKSKMLLSFTEFSLTASVLWVFMSTVVLTLIAGTAVVTYNYLKVLRLRKTLPPGPLPWPLFGNHFHIPKWQPWIKFEQWSHQYNNPMITIWLGSKPVVILNDAWTASQLLEQRADVFSSRPRFIGMGDLSNTTTNNQAVLVYGDQWRMHRKLTHNIVGSHVVRDYRPFQGDESKILTLDFLTDPSDFVMSIERYSVSVVSIIGWGRRIARQNDYVCQQAIASMEKVNAVIPGWFIVESLPWMVHLPAWLYAMPTRVRTGAANAVKYFCALNQEAAMTSPHDCFAKTVLAKQEEFRLRDAEVASLTTNLLGAGVDTTSGTLSSTVLALCVFQDVQRKAQAEIDAVCGDISDPAYLRSPTWEDFDAKRLPYVQALAKEILRWRTVTILGGIPHAPTADYEYRGFTIPAGTQITCNVWAMHRHPREYPEPDVVRPERFLDASGKGESLAFDYPNNRGHNAFGWGRRACSGQPLAEQSLLSALARMLWAFKIEPGLDEEGNEVKLDVFAYNDSENMRPLPFKARFTPRSPAVERMLRSEAQEARERLSKYDGDTKLTVESVLAGKTFSEKTL